MKEKKKPKGTKAEIRAYKKRSTLIGTAIIVAVLVVIISVFSFFVFLYLNPSPNQPQNPNQPIQPKAAIVDHLSLTVPNQNFVETVTTILREAGYAVDYYPGEEVNVEFYRNLPTHGYGLIILRVHSTASALQGNKTVDHAVALFSCEPYSNKYPYEQLTNQIGSVSYHLGEPPYYFAIHPSFVVSSMKGSFQNATVIMMGCEGLRNDYMALAFTKKGAKVCISWDGPVSASHTDQATTQLLRHLLTEKQTIEKAVLETMEEVGSDPGSGSVLRYYPDT